MIQGWCRKHVEKSKNLQIKVFPIRYLALNRISGVLKIYKNQLEGLVFHSETKNIQDCCALASEEAPPDFPFKMQIVAEGQQISFYFASGQERAMWIREICTFLN